MRIDDVMQGPTNASASDGGREKLRVPTWEEIAVLDAELRRRAGKHSSKLARDAAALETAALEARDAAARDAV